MGLSQKQLIALHDRWERETRCSTRPVEFREPTCVVCAAKVRKCFHVWLNYRSRVTRRKVTKELHFCKACGERAGYEA